MLLIGDALTKLRELPAESVHCCVTSPPYFGLRDYGIEGQIGLEKTPQEYVEKLAGVFREVKRVLRPDGTLWLNLGDSYNAGRDGGWPGGKAQWDPAEQKYVGRSGANVPGLKPKDLIGIPWRVAFALQADGWWLRADIIWAKGAVMPESITDRPTKSHEYIFLLAKSPHYFYDLEAIREPLSEASLGRYDYAFGGAKAEQLTAGEAAGPGTRTHPIGRRQPQAGRNKRSVWHINPKPYPEAHFATFPPEIPETCIKAGTSEKGCCPACGAPWARIVETNNPSKQAADEDTRGWANTHQQTSNPQSSKSLHRTEGGVYPTAQTLGWQPTCKCPPAEPVPCVVLDPFSGSGTTLAIAVELRRRYVGIELNPEYAKLIEERLRRPSETEGIKQTFDLLMREDD